MLSARRAHGAGPAVSVHQPHVSITRFHEYICSKGRRHPQSVAVKLHREEGTKCFCFKKNASGVTDWVKIKLLPWRLPLEGCLYLCAGAADDRRISGAVVAAAAQSSGEDASEPRRAPPRLILQPNLFYTTSSRESSDRSLGRMPYSPPPALTTRISLGEMTIAAQILLDFPENDVCFFFISCDSMGASVCF